MSKKSVAIIEARMTSSRLPGKVLMASCGKPILQLMIERVKRSRLLSDVVVATTVNKEDDPIVSLCRDIGCTYFRGSENDVLDRVSSAAAESKTDVVVELTGDCPFIDWRHIDYLLSIYDSGKYDYVANNMKQTFPVGFDIRIFSAEMIAKLNKETKSMLDREHVSIHFPNHPEIYKCFNWEASQSEYAPDIEVTLDEMGDYKLINAIFEGLYPTNEDFKGSDVVSYIKENPNLLTYVQGIKRTQFIYDN